MTGPAVALALVDLRHLPALGCPGALTVAACGAALGWRHDPFGGALAARRVTRLQVGGEACERLLPAPRLLAAALEFAQARGLDLSLATPLLSDQGMAELRCLLDRLPAGTEVIANDWGTLRLLAHAFPALVPVAGRLMCKLVKDPRLPSAAWARLYPHGIQAAPFAAMLARFGVRRIEMDVPPFADAADFPDDGLQVGVHAPFGVSAKGRSCRIGSLHQPEVLKFAAGHRCARECLTYTAAMTRPLGAADLPTHLRGTTLLHAHSPAMAEALLAAAAAGAVDRIILSGDWH